MTLPLSFSPKKIAVVTATRAEYGLLSPLILCLENSPNFECQLYVTGAHLLAEQGYTVEQIRLSGYTISAEIPILVEGHEQTDLELSLATAKALQGFALAFAKFQPDAVVVLGDRYELLGVCSAALLAHIPIMHLHGGEVTEGAMDDAIRHAITKMASLHFVAAEAYRQRVIQMGEPSKTVFNVGATGLDVIQTLDFLSQSELEASLGMSLKISPPQPIFLVTYHPVSWGETAGIKSLEQLFEALEAFPSATIVWTGANTDAGGQVFNDRIQAWVKNTALNAKYFPSLGSQRYLSLMKLSSVVLGNSSSGIIEAPALGVATVNIGSRQKGRLMANSIFQASEDVSSIQSAIQQALDFDVNQTQSLYGQGETANAMVSILEQTDFSQLLPKVFYDVPIEMDALSEVQKG